MPQEDNQSLPIHEINKLKPIHFADLVRSAQLIFDPAAGVPGSSKQVDWLEEFGIPAHVEQNLKALGEEYRYASPHIPVEVVWSKLTPETRIWFIDNKEKLWRIEEAFPALDED